MKLLNRLLKKSQKGQVLIIVAIMLTALVAIIGLAIDMGYAYVSYARLRRAVDAAALAGSGEFKRNYVSRLDAAARQVLYLNLGESPTNNPSTFATDIPNIKVETCITVAADHGILEQNMRQNIDALYDDDAEPRVCTKPSLRKIVRVTVTENVPFFFLQVVPGMPRNYPIQVVSLSEAATVDVLMAIDTSDSMTYGWPGNPTVGQHRDPSYCNVDDPNGLASGDLIDGSCFPFQDVKRAANLFLQNLYFPYDRVGIVTFDRDAMMQLELSEDSALISTTILHLHTFDSNRCPYDTSTPGYNDQSQRQLGTALTDPNFIPCRFYDAQGNYQYMDCSTYWGPTPAAKQCMNTNIGDGVAMAGSILTGVYPTDPSLLARSMPAGGWPDMHEQALWVVLLLTDGASNTGHANNSAELCPGTEETYAWGDIPAYHPLCRDNDVLTRHCWLNTDTSCIDARYPTDINGNNLNHSIVDQSKYDGDDRARDMFDIVSANRTLIFTIGMGDANSDNENPRVDVNGMAPGQTLLQYGAFGTYTDMTDKTSLKGLYYFGNDPADLTRIFLAIANNLATRINQ